MMKIFYLKNILPVDKRFVLLLICIGTYACCSSQPVRSLDLTLQDFQYPFPVHYLSIHCQKEEVRLAYMDVQPEAPNGHTVMLLHGKNFCSAYWERTAKELVKSGYRVIMPDQAGFGKSSKPQHIQYSFQLLAGQTKQLLAELNVRKVIVLGHSMGGMLAVRFALMYPQLTEGLILEDPIGLEDWKVKVPYQTVDELFKKEKTQSYEKIKKYQQQNYYHGTWKPEYDQWVNIPAGWTLNPNYDSIAWNSALTYDMIFTQPVIYEFENIIPPVLLIIGDLDRTALGKDVVDEETARTLGNYPVLGKKAAEKIRNNKLVVLPGIGHIPHLESFDLFMKEVMDFLRR